MDKIIEGYLKDFSIEFALESSQPAVLFEHFVNYCTVAAEIAHSPDLTEIHVGGGGDGGLDGVAIVVNDHLITSVDQIEAIEDGWRSRSCSRKRSRGANSAQQILRPLSSASRSSSRAPPRFR